MTYAGKLDSSLRFLLSLLLLTGCQALTSTDNSAALIAEMTYFLTEAAAIQQAAAIDQTRAVSTLAAASTQAAEAASVNAALAATISAGFTATPPIRAVIVSAADMSSSLGMDMMDDRPANDDVQMRVSNAATARRVNPNNGCASGNVVQFNSDDERIYVTARVSPLANETDFVVDWLYENRVVYRSSWQADYSAAAECIWFYATPSDFPFLPGAYAAALYVNGRPEPSIPFSIRAG